MANTHGNVFWSHQMVHTVDVLLSIVKWFWPLLIVSFPLPKRKWRNFKIWPNFKAHGHSSWYISSIFSDDNTFEHGQPKSLIALVIMGSNDRLSDSSQRIRTTVCGVHPGFKTDGPIMYYDIAFCQLKTPIILDDPRVRTKRTSLERSTQIQCLKNWIKGTNIELRPQFNQPACQGLLSWVKKENKKCVLPLALEQLVSYN